MTRSSDWSPADTRELYDSLSAAFLRCAGPTFQAGLVRREDGSEDAAASNLALARAAGIADGNRILDAGCGVAGPAVDIAQAFPNCQIDGITISPVQVEIGARRVAQLGLSDRVRLHEGDYHQLPFPDGSFDVVTFFESSEYSPEPARLFAEVARVLAPGGRVYVKAALRRDGELNAQQSADLREYDAMWSIKLTPSRSEMETALEEAGFLDLESEWMELGSGHFIGSMFDLTAEGLRTNEFGDALFRRFVDLPVAFAQLRARR